MTGSAITSMSPGVATSGPERTSAAQRADARVVRSVAELRAALAPARRAERAIGLVPTMGALHDGHLSLIERARRECDVVVVSLFVNPSQFDERADLERYPRDEARDRELAERAGADVLFAPDVEEVYPAGFATAVEVLGLTDRLEGAVRGASHFRGVATVVTKLLNMVGPDVAYFGQKDAQQALVICRLVADLDLPVRIETCPTVREPDGLAMSSRNARLSADERERATALFGGLKAARASASAGERDGAALLEQARAAMARLGVEPEYLALVDPRTLEPVATLREPALLAVAARIGETRLIDNLMLEPTPLPALAGAERARDRAEDDQSPPAQAARATAKENA
jgi:pantoate--beta-alanine ligase